MANSKEIDAALTLWRFGLGAREGDLQAIKDDPRDLLRQEVVECYTPTPVGAALRSSADLLMSLIEYNKEVQAERDRPAPAPMPAPQSVATATGNAAGQTAPPGA
uniref:hypothetical protein n=1 Tax=Neorhizobium sp. EC2-8 TaxID=3129230 RepID=UPI0031010E99